MFGLAKNCAAAILKNSLPRFLAGAAISNRFVSTNETSEKRREFTIPIVDLGKLGLNHHPDPDDSDWQRVAEEITDAFQTYNFAYLAGHGIPYEHFQEVSKASLSFFGLPKEEKLKYKRDVQKFHGYLPFDTERLDPRFPIELRESFEFGCARDLVFPDGLVPELRPAARDYMESCRRLMNRLLVVTAIGLGLSRDFLLDYHRLLGHEGNRSCGRVLHYPPYPEGTPRGEATRGGKHIDVTTMTLLFQDDNGGLQLRDPSGEWMEATPIPETVTVIIGNLLQFWTSGKFKAVEHQVVIPKDEAIRRKPRLSAAYFTVPDSAAVVTPLDGSSSEQVLVDTYLDTLIPQYYSPEPKAQ